MVGCCGLTAGGHPKPKTEASIGGVFKARCLGLVGAGGLIRPVATARTHNSYLERAKEINTKRGGEPRGMR